MLQGKGYGRRRDCGGLEDGGCGELKQAARWSGGGGHEHGGGGWTGR